MKNLLSILLLIALSSSISMAQLNPYSWRVGVSAGTSNYYGDIQPYGMSNFGDFLRLYDRNDRYADQYSFQFSLEKSLSPSVGLMFTLGSYQFGSADRLIRNDGTINRQGPDFDRALNFQTNLRDAGLSLVFKTDNDKLLSANSFIAPYFTLGVGVLDFDVSGDLLDANGNRYDYTQQSTIPDGDFETDLRPLRTEGKDYDSWSVYANLGLGLRFRITRQLELFVQSDFRYTATDYLDDVSGRYPNSYQSEFQEYASRPGTNLRTRENFRGNPNGQNDWYIYHGVGLKISFGSTKESFRAPVISQRTQFSQFTLPQNTEEDEHKEKEEETSDEKAEEKSERDENPGSLIINNYYNNFFNSGNQQTGGGTLASDNAILRLQARRVEINTEMAKIDQQIDSLQNESSWLRTQLFEIEGDSTLTDSLKNERINPLAGKSSELVEVLETKNTEKEDLENELDEIENQIEQLQNNRGLDSLQNSPPSGNAASPQVIYFQPQNSENTAPKESSDFGYELPGQNSPTDSVYTGNMSRIRSDFELFNQSLLKQQERNDSLMRDILRDQDSNSTDVQQQPPTQIIMPRRMQIVEVDESEDRGLLGLFGTREAREERRLRRRNNALLYGGAATTGAVLAGQGNQCRSLDTIEENDSIREERITELEEEVDSLMNDPSQKENPENEETPEEEIIEERVVTDTVRISIPTPLFPDLTKIDLYFEVNEQSLVEEEKLKLERLADFLKENDDYSVLLTGYADNTGSLSYNLRLTETRVTEVKQVLIEELEIAGDRVRQKSGGQVMRTNARASNDEDRRVEVKLVKGGDQ